MTMFHKQNINKSNTIDPNRLNEERISFYF